MFEQFIKYLQEYFWQLFQQQNRNHIESSINVIISIVAAIVLANLVLSFIAPNPISVAIGFFGTTLLAVFFAARIAKKIATIAQRNMVDRHELPTAPNTPQPEPQNVLDITQAMALHADSGETSDTEEDESLVPLSSNLRNRG